ncbi:hypothetical protein V8F20_002698 [Naviculisporaceae sp. PSN 640]
MSKTEIRSAQQSNHKAGLFWPWRRRRLMSPRPLGLSVVYNPSHEQTVVDLVAVHGFDGNFESWVFESRRKSGFGRSTTFGKSTAFGRSTAVSWLTPALLPKARILTFSYNTDVRHGHELTRRVLFGNSLCLVEDLSALREKTHSQGRPIIFVAHSLGGLMVKIALVSCQDPANPGFYDIGQSASAVHFFGTPSSGLSQQSFSAAVKNMFLIMSTKDKHKSRKHTRELRNDKDDTNWMDKDAKWLETKIQPFKPLVPFIHVYTYYESKKTESINQLVVQRQSSFASVSSRDSATSTSSTRSHQTTLPEKDHASLMTFTNESDEQYRSFQKNLEESLKPKSNRRSELEEHAAVTTYASSGANLHRPVGDLQMLSNVPKGRCSITRLPILHAIYELHLTPGRKTSEFPVLVLHGASSAELSSFACSLASVALEETPNAFMYRFNAETADTVTAGYLELACSLRNRYREGGDDTCGRAARYLERSIGIRNIEDMLKVDSVGRLEAIYLRSVIQAVHEWLLVPQNENWLLIFDNVVDPHGIREMLPLRSSGRIILTTEDPEQIPLGLGLRAALPETTESTCKDEPATRPPESLDNIWLDDKKQLVRNILATASVLSEYPVPVALFFSSNEHFTGFTPNDLRSMEQVGLLQLASDAGMANGRILRRDQFVIPTHIRSACLERLEDNKLDHWVIVASRLCIDFFQQAKRGRCLLEIQALERTMVPHARASYARLLKCNKDLLDNIPLDTLGDICLHQGALEEAEGYFRMACRSGTLTLDRQAEIILSLSTTLRRKGQIEAYLESLQRPELNKIVGDLSCPSLVVKIQLAKADARAIENQLDSAEVCIKEALNFLDELALESLSEKDSRPLVRADVVRKLAENLMLQNKHEEAQELNKRAYIEYRQLLGPLDPLTIEMGENLAGTMQMCGQEIGAMDLLRRMEKIKRESLGESHPSTGITLAKIAAMLDARGDSGEAKKMFDNALRIMTDAVGPHHPWVMRTKESIASGRCMRGEYNEAVEILDGVIKAKTSSAEVYGRDDISSSEVKRVKVLELRSGRTFDENLSKKLEHVLHLPGCSGAPTVPVTEFLLFPSYSTPSHSLPGSPTSVPQPPAPQSSDLLLIP